MRGIIISIFLLIGPMVQSQSAWTQEKNQWYTQINYSFISNYNEVFGSPDYTTERFITDNTLQLYAEFGLLQHTTLLVNIPFKFIETGRLSDVTNTAPNTTQNNEAALGNISIGVRQQIHRSKWVVAAQFNIEWNSSRYFESSGIRTGYDAMTFSPTLNLGRSFNKTYFQSFTGFDLRTNSYSSNFRLGGEFGLLLSKRIWIIVYVDIVQSLKNGDLNLPLNNLNTALYVNNQSYGGYGLKSIVKIIQNFGVTGSFGGAFFGENVAKKVALNFGLYHKF